MVISDSTRSKAADAHVRARLAEGLCIACPEGDVRRHVKRGNCTRCNARYEDQLAKLNSDEDRAEFESRAIKAGLVLQSNEIRELTAELKKSNPFIDLRKQVEKS